VNWRRPIAPLGLSVAMALLLGVALVQLFPSLPAWSLTLAASVVLAFLFLRDGLSRLVIALLFGISWACLFGQLALEQRLPQAMDNQDFTIDGEVLGLPQVDENSVRFDFQVQRSDQTELVGRKIRLGWYRQAQVPAPGSHWRFTATLKRPRGVLNPGKVL